MPSSSYRIVDEPTAGPLDRAVVSPTWPMFAMMLGGAWLAWPWFLFNAWAMNSPRLARNIAWVVGGLAVSVGIAGAAVFLFQANILPKGAMPYVAIAIILWKLLVTYVLTLDQERSFELHQYFGGTVASGMWVMLIGSFYLDRLVLKQLQGVDETLLRSTLIWVLM